MNGGDITFNTRIDDSDVEKELARTKKKIEKETAKRDSYTASRDDLEKRFHEQGVELEKKKALLPTLTEGSQRYQMWTQWIKDITRDQNEMNRALQKYDSQIEESNKKIAQQKELYEELSERAKTLPTTVSDCENFAQGDGGSPFSGWDEALKKVEKRIAGLIQRVFFFSLVTKALRVGLAYFGKLLNANKEFQAEFGKMKAALATAFQPLIEVAIPAFITLLRILTAVFSVIANIVGRLFGKSAAQSAKDAKAMNAEADALKNVGGAAASAEKKLASFDEINNLGDSGGGGGGGGSAVPMDFDGLNLDEYNRRLLEFQAGLSAAALALGVILTLSGANIPLGLAMIALGAAGLYGLATENWNEIPTEVMKSILKILTIMGVGILAIGAILCFSGVKVALGVGLMAAGAAILFTAVAVDWHAMEGNITGAISGILQIVSPALLALGAILCFTGVAVPLGIGMLAAGAIGLAAAAAINWESLSNELQGPIGETTALVSGALIALGAILCFSGVAMPLGIGLLAAGAVGLGTTAAANWSAITEALQGPIGAVTAAVSTALLVVGALLCFSGVGIPLGIGLLAAGAVGLGTTAAVNWDAITEALQGPIGAITATVSAALLVIGAILCFSGVGIPLGIGLIAAGAIGLGTTASLNWNSITEALQGPIGAITATVSAALLVIGIILCFTGVGIPLGIGLIAAGAAGLATTTAVNWDFLTDKIAEIWGSITAYWNTNIAPKFTLAYWSDKFSCIGEGLTQKIKDGINVAISLFNQFISWINSKMNISWGSFEIFGQEVIPSGSFQLVSIPSIPLLAKGAVIPPNSPFLAMVGDQKHGTNIEAPLSTIQEAVAAVINSDMLYQAFLRALVESGAGRTYLDGREIYDSVTEYQRRHDIAFGW